jgi:hypothetical protein
MNYLAMKEMLEYNRAECAEKGFRAGYYKAIQVAMEEGLFADDWEDDVYDKVLALVEKRLQDFLIECGF